MNIRKLTIDDLDDYKNIRLELLTNHPENFGSDALEEAAFEEQMWTKRIINKNVDSYGAFYEEEIVGLAVCVKNPRRKMKHFAHISSIYVKPSMRGHKIARNIIGEIINNCINSGLEFVRLSVVTTNEPAINLYKSMGFEAYGTEKKSINLNGRYYDLLLLQKELK